MREKFLLWFAALAAFGGCAFAAFEFDDFALFSKSPVMLPARWIDCFRQTRPLTELSFWLNDALFGRSPVSWHVVDLLLHLAVVALVFDVLRKLIGDRSGWIAAAIFAVHPMMTEPVAYVFARATLLATLFSLLAMRSWIAGRFWIAVLWFAAGMLAKEECAALPLVLILLPPDDRSLRSRLSSVLSRDHRERSRGFLVMLVVALAIGIRTLFAAAAIPGSGVGANAGISPLAYLESQGLVIWRYLRLFVIPWGFSIDPSLSRPPLWVALSAWAALAAVCLIPFRGRFWFLMGLLLLTPSSSILPAADLAADRRMYLPMIAFCACAGVLLETVDRRAILAMVLALMAISIRYSILWAHPDALWGEAKRLAPDAVRPRIQLARTLPPARELEELKDAPDVESVATERGRLLLTLGRPAEALSAFGRALALNPNDARAISNRAVALAALGSRDAAIAEFQRALEKDACLSDARENLSKLGLETAAPANCH
ncbi:MAG TPA: tetratricopeptide repeat protein [Bryobacteraceae bacterium]|nr:tetratricopeptide repeat protein [Bryobacteraceae bacterium]